MRYMLSALIFYLLAVVYFIVFMISAFDESDFNYMIVGFLCLIVGNQESAKVS